MDRICGHIMLNLRNCNRNMVKMFTHDNISMVSGTNRLTANLKKKKFHKMTRDQVLHHVQI